MVIFHRFFDVYQRVDRFPQVEMAIASFAQFFLAFGDGIVQGHVSKPSLLTMQMRPVLGDGMRLVPFGKRLHNYGKSACLMGQSTISMVHFP